MITSIQFDQIRCEDSTWLQAKANVKTNTPGKDKWGNVANDAERLAKPITRKLSNASVHMQSVLCVRMCMYVCAYVCKMRLCVRVCACVGVRALLPQRCCNAVLEKV